MAPPDASIQDLDARESPDKAERVKLHASKESEAAAACTSSSAPAAALLVVVWYIALVSSSQQRFWSTPAPLPATAPAGTFSEARAREHTRVLVEVFPDRQVSLPDLDGAHHYIIDHGRMLAEEAAARNDLFVQVDVESHDGAFPFDFMGHDITNAYYNVTNVIILVSPRGPAAARPAVMVVAHQDSAVSSRGAGDDAGNVGAMMELISNMVAAEKPPITPVLFLFSGAEEPFCQSASAFMHRSKWAPLVGSFVNLEALGPGGVPIVFQHAGAWTIRAYAKGAAHPRGAIAAQDVFDAKLVMGETDFSRLSYRHAGRLPGIDIAYVADGAAYHTSADTMERLREGVLQEVGETLTGVIRTMGEELAARHDAGATPPAGDRAADGQQAGEEEGKRRTAAEARAAVGQGMRAGESPKAMFFSLHAKCMVVYSLEAARKLHVAPVVVALSMPWVLAQLAPGRALAPWEGLKAALGGAVRALGCLVLSPALTGAFGVARALISGTPMIWFSSPWVAAAIFFPAAFAIQLFLYSGPSHAAASSHHAGGKLAAAGGGSAAAAGAGGVGVAYHVLGGAIMNGMVAAVATRFDIGMSSTFAMWAASGVLACPLVLGGVSNLGSVMGVLLVTAVPTYACCELALGVCMALVSRMSLTGHIFTGMGDLIAGVLVAVGAVAVMGGINMPIIAAALGRRARRVAGLLLLASAVAAAYASLRVAPYTATMPKRLLLLHLHRTEPSPGGAAASGAPHVASRVVSSQWAFGGTDSTPTGRLMRGMRLPVAQSRGVTVVGDEFSSIYPISTLVDARLLPAEPLSPAPVKVLPYARLVAEDTNVLTAGEGGGTYRDVVFEVYTEKPAWGMLNVTSDDGILSWSLTSERWPRSSAPRTRIVQWTTQKWGEPWRATVRVAAGGKGTGAGAVRLQLHVDYLESTPRLRNMIGRLPPWGTMTYAATCYISSWVF